MISFFYVVSYCHLSAALQTVSITVETYKTVELWFEFFIILSRFSVDSPLNLLLQKIRSNLVLLGFILSVKVLKFFVLSVSYSENMPKIKAVCL